MQFPHAGQTFQGKYKLLEVLGRGGFAAVYKAFDEEIGREVAIKLLMPSEDGYESSIVARFQREARIIAQLKDPHTITMFDFGRTDDGLLYMVFEYVAGADLSHRLEETGPASGAVVSHVLDQLLQALREAHEAGVLHRDIKPANVLVFPYLDDDWQVKLLDFGIAKPGIGQNADPVATLTRAGGIIGTPRYMSPEQLCGEELNPTTDIYSLGLVAYEMLVGTPAIAGRDTRDNIVLQLSTDPLVLPHDLPIPPPLRRIIERMMAREPENRFQSAREVIVALRRLDATSGSHTARYGAMSTSQIGSGPYAAPTTGPHTHIPTDSHGLAGPSSSAELAYRTPTTGPHPPLTAPTTPEKQGLSPLAMLGVGAAFGAALVIPLMMIVLDDDKQPSPVITPELTSSKDRGAPLTKQQPETEPRSDPEPTTDSPARTPDLGPKVAIGCGAPAPQTGFVVVDSDTVGINARPVMTYIPKSYDPDHRHAIVVVFHDRTRDPKRAITDMKLTERAEEHNLIIVAPAGLQYNMPWNPDGDAEFVTDALNQVSETYCVDRSRRYGIGHNVGAAALERFACLIPFSAIATTAHRGTEQLACDYRPPVPHIHLVGNKDNYHPLRGGNTCDLRTIPSLEAKNELWIKQNRCKGKRRKYLELDTGVCETFERCEAPYVACIMDGGRDWPDSASRDIQLPTCIQASTKFPISETVYDFLSKHGHALDVLED